MHTDLNDPDGFHIRDDSLYYRDTRLEYIDIDSLEIIDDWFCKDKYHVYNALRPMEGVDPATFTPLYATSGELRQRFSKDAESVYFETTRIDGVDVDTFQVLDEFHAKDKQHIYFMRECFADADVDYESFEGLGLSFARDRQHVYYYGKVFAQADRDSFQVLDPNHWDSYVLDKNTVYTSSAEALPDVDVASFTCLQHHPYAKDKQRVYRFADTLAGADPDSFYSLGYHFGKDAKKVFYENRQIKGADVASFVMFSENELEQYSHDKNHVYYCHKTLTRNGSIESFVAFNYNYYKDDANAYYDGEVLADADLPSFAALDSSLAYDDYAIYYDGVRYAGIDIETFRFLSPSISKDKHHVYYMLEPIDDLDPSNVELIDEHYLKDRQNVYYLHERYYTFEKIKGIDAASFSMLTPYYSCDKDHVYFESACLPHSDAESFVELEGAYARDRQHVYYAQHLLEAADAASFVCINYAYARDKHRIYIYETAMPNSDPQSFVIMNDDYAKDKNNVYYRDMIVETAQADSFEIISPWYARDAQHYFAAQQCLELNYDQVQILSDTYVRDDASVLYLGRSIEGVDLDSFTIIDSDSSLARDRQHVYFREDVIAGADAESFHIINRSHCRDKLHDYYMREGHWQTLEALQEKDIL